MCVGVIFFFFVEKYVAIEREQCCAPFFANMLVFFALILCFSIVPNKKKLVNFFPQSESYGFNIALLFFPFSFF